MDAEIEHVLQRMLVRIEGDAVSAFLLRRQREYQQDLMRLESVQNTELYKMMRLLLVYRMQQSIFDHVRIKKCKTMYAMHEAEEPVYKEVITVVIDEVMRAHQLDPTIVLGSGINSERIVEEVH